MDDQLDAIFQARGETYREFTQQLADYLPELVKAVHVALQERSIVVNQGVTVRVTDITKMFNNSLAVSLIMEFPLGTYNIDGDHVEVTEENQMMFKYMLHYVYDMDMVLRRDHAELLAATFQQMSSEEPDDHTPELKPSNTSTQHEFDLDGLTPEQKTAYLLHMRTNPK